MKWLPASEATGDRIGSLVGLPYVEKRTGQCPYGINLHPAKERLHAPFAWHFPVVQTPFMQDGLLDVASRKREVAFCVRSQAHGLVYPVPASEFQVLTDRERRQGVETVLHAAANRVPVVMGVAAPSATAAAAYARLCGH